MARYNRWMNAKVYAAAADLGDEDRKRDRGAFFKSIHATLNHLMVADRIWVSRLTGEVAEPGFMAPGIRALDQELFADFAALQSERTRLDAQIVAWADGITTDALQATLRSGVAGKQRAYPCWWAALQMFNHQTHHRGQITTLFTQGGQEVGSTDVLAMLFEEARG